MLETSLPPQDVRDDITAKLDTLVRGLQAHPSYTPPEPPRGLSYVWDSVNRSKYTMEELENVRQGNTVKYPDRLHKAENDRKTYTPERIAQTAFVSVATTTIMANDIIQNPAKLISLGMSQIDFGNDIRTKSAAASAAVRRAVPDE